jgi:hypothetical protein
MASTDARPVPQKNVAYRVTFPIYDADGDLVTGAAGLDSEISKDGGTFADVTAEATEIATASGMYFLDLTSTEMNADTVAIIVKTSTVGAKTTAVVLYPEEAGDIRVNVTQNAGTNITSAAGIQEVKVASIANNAITAAAINADAITDAKVAADVTIASVTGSVGSVTGAVGSVTGAVGSVTGNVGGNVNGSVASIAANGIAATSIATGAITAAKFAANAIDAAAVATGAIDADALATDAAAEIADAVWDELLSGHVIVGSAGAALQAAGSAGDPWSTALPGAYGAGTAGAIVPAIKAKTDLLTFTVANQLDSRTMSMANGAVTAAAVATDAIDADALAADALTEINAQVVDALATDTYAEPGQGNPAATASLATKIGYIYKGTRNKHDQNATTFELYADDGTTVDQKATVSDDGTTFTRGKLTSGP